MKAENRYFARGFSFNNINEYLLGVVGDVHTLDEWIQIVFFRNYETAKDFFQDFSEKEIVDYINSNYCLRLEKYKGG